MVAAKKWESALEDVALVASTQQNLSNLYSLDIYGCHAAQRAKVSSACRRLCSCRGCFHQGTL
jgi:hypothetical protein